jgi:hypothetical protein
MPRKIKEKGVLLGCDRASQLRHDYVKTTSIINGTKSKIEEELWIKYPFERVTRDRHGIKLSVLQSGRLGAFHGEVILDR